MTNVDCSPLRRSEEIEVVEVPVHTLKAGMYVCGLDRPWSETPFLMQGFNIDCSEDIEQISHYCKKVHVDMKRSYADLPVVSRPMRSMTELFPGRQLKKYTRQATWKRELPEARKALGNLATDTVAMMRAIRSDTPFDMNHIKSSVSGVIDSVIRNPDTSMWLSRLKTKDDYLYSHSVSCAIWAVAIGRQIGLPRHDLRTLAIGSLLFDAGKVRLPASLLTKTSPITVQERQLLNQHVDEGLKVLSTSAGFGPDILDIVHYHHERHDGSGYPEGLSGDEIPIMARIVSIVDCYDAMTSERYFAKASSPSIVTRKLYAWRDRLFQAELVEEFIQAVGLYPAGTLVELSTGEVGIVTAVSKAQRLRPRVIILLNASKQLVGSPAVINLAETQKNAAGESLNIVKSLEPGIYGIDPRTIGQQ